MDRDEFEQLRRVIFSGKVSELEKATASAWKLLDCSESSENKLKILDLLLDAESFLALQSKCSKKQKYHLKKALKTAKLTLLEQRLIGICRVFGLAFYFRDRKILKLAMKHVFDNEENYNFLFYRYLYYRCMGLLIFNKTVEAELLFSQIPPSQNEFSSHWIAVLKDFDTKQTEKMLNWLQSKH